MRYLFTMLAVLAVLGASGCASDTKLTPPEHVLDPRGEQ
jgi:hypothetical protein